MRKAMDKFLANPTMEQYNEFLQKDVAIELLKQHPSTAKRQYFLTTIGESEIYLSEIARLALSENDIELFYELVELDSSESFIEHCATYAAFFDRFEEMKYMIELGANDWNSMAISAAETGSIDTLYYLIGRGSDDWEWIAKSATIYGQLNIVEEMIERGATDINGIAKYAIDEGSPEIAIRMIEGYTVKGKTLKANNFNYLAKKAALNNHKELLKLCIAGANNFDEIAQHASHNGHIEIVKEMLSKLDYSDISFAEIARVAAIHGHKDVMEYILKLQRDTLYSMYPK